MAQRASYKKRNNSFPIRATAALVVVVVVAFVLFFGLEMARGDNGNDDTTLGIGEMQNTVEPDSASSDEAPDAQEAQDSESQSDVPVVSDKGVADGQHVEASSAESLKSAQQRTFTVEDPEPTVVLAGVDAEDPNTVMAAAEIGTTNPLPTAEHLKVDTSGDDWQTGLASAYDVASSSTLTYSGRGFDDDCVTVAVPQGMEEYVGRPIEIVWHDKVVIATVTDTGGFAKYGRSLDLGGGVWKAFGCQNVADWGVQTVKYRYL